MYIFFVFPFATKLYLLKKKKRKHNQYIYCTNDIQYFSKIQDIYVYAGATEETSVFDDEETSEPSSASLPKSCMMHERN